MSWDPPARGRDVPPGEPQAGGFLREPHRCVELPSREKQRRCREPVTTVWSPSGSPFLCHLPDVCWAGPLWHLMRTEADVTYSHFSPLSHCCRLPVSPYHASCQTFPPAGPLQPASGCPGFPVHLEEDTGLRSGLRVSSSSPLPLWEALPPPPYPHTALLKCHGKL